MIKAPQRRRRDRKRADPGTPPTVAQTAVTSVTAGTDTVVVVFASTVIINPSNLPATWVFGTANRTVVTALSTNGTTWTLGVSGSVASGQAYSMPANDPAARTPSGGYVAASTGTLA
jgi:hypothetical protein